MGVRGSILLYMFQFLPAGVRVVVVVCRLELLEGGFVVGGVHSMIRGLDARYIFGNPSSRRFFPFPPFLVLPSFVWIACFMLLL